MKFKCLVDECERRAEVDRKLCYGHRMREREGEPVEAPLRPWGQKPQDKLDRAALEFAEAKAESETGVKADAERAYFLARHRMRMAAMEYAGKAKRKKVPNRQKTRGSKGR